MENTSAINVAAATIQCLNACRNSMHLAAKIFGAIPKRRVNIFYEQIKHLLTSEYDAEAAAKCLEQNADIVSAVLKAVSEKTIDIRFSRLDSFEAAFCVKMALDMPLIRQEVVAKIKDRGFSEEEMNEIYNKICEIPTTSDRDFSNLFKITNAIAFTIF